MKKMFKHNILTLFLGSTCLSCITTIPFTGQNLDQTKTIKTNSLNANSIEKNNNLIKENNSINFSHQNIQDDYKTPFGYIQITPDLQKIKLITYFGNVVWEYLVIDSQFYKSLPNYKPENKIFSLHAKYLNSKQTILIYGNVLIEKNVYESFVFQLNAKDGTEFFINNKNDYKNSVFTYTERQKGWFLYLIEIYDDNTIVLLPKDQKSYGIEACYLNVNDYSTKKINLNFKPVLNDTTLAENSHNVVGDKFRFNEILAFRPLSIKQQTSLILIKAERNILNAEVDKKYELGIASIVIDSKLNLITSDFLGFVTKKDPHIRREEYNFIIKTKKINDHYQTYAINNTKFNVFVPGTKNVQLRGYNNVVLSYGWINNNINTDLKNNFFTQKLMMKNFNDNNSLGMVSQLFYNPYTNKIYVIGHKENNRIIYFIKELNINETDNALINDREVNIDFSWTIDFTNKINITNINDVYSIEFLFVNYKTIYNNSSNKQFPFIGLVHTKNETKLYAVVLDENGKIIKISDFNQTFITNNSKEISKKFNNYLPQDILIEQLNDYIYLHDNQNLLNKLYQSNISKSKNLIIDDNNGSISGFVNLELKNWWDTSNSETTKIPLKVNIINLATEKDYNFFIVNDNKINNNKFIEIQKLQKTKLPSEINANQILNSFLEFGKYIPLTSSDISFASDNTKIIKPVNVIANDNKGTLKIEYDFSLLNVSPSKKTIKGSYEFNGFLSLQKLKINQQKLDELKQNKIPFQIGLKEILSVIEIPENYDKNPQNWLWKPNYDISVNKSKYIEESINGSLTGVIEYHGKINGQPVNASDHSLQINETNFKTIIQAITDNDGKILTFNSQKANELGKEFDIKNIEENNIMILKQSINFSNNWTNFDSLLINVASISANVIHNQIMLNNQKIKTNFLDANQNILILDKDWINAINLHSNLLQLSKINFDYQFNENLFEWNYGIPTNSKELFIDKKENQTGIEAPNKFKQYSNYSPTKFIEKFYNDKTNDYQNFQNEFNLLNIDNTISKNDPGYFEIIDVKLVPDNQKGSVTVKYVVSYPNIQNNNNQNGVVVYPELTIYGFKNNSYQISQTITIAVSSISTIIVICALLSYFYIEMCKRKYLNVNINYSHLSDNEKKNIWKVYNFLFKNKLFYEKTKYLSPSNFFSKQNKQKQNYNLENKKEQYEKK